MRYFFLFFAITIFTQSCGESTQKENNTTDITEANIPNKKAVDHQQLQKQYASYFANRSNWLRPNKIIEKGKINAFDEALKDTSFFVFREHLLSIINQKSIVDLLSFVDDNIVLSRDTLSGIPHFIHQWHLTSPDSIEQSNVWIILQRILENGGYFNRSKTVFTAPYYADNKGMSAKQGCILGQGVRIRNRPGLNAQIVQKVSFDIVDIIEIMDKKEIIGEEVFPWVHIRLQNGKEGYIWGKFIGYSQGDKITFQKDQQGNWMMKVFVTTK